MPLPPRRTGTSVFGRTLETVLAERPCRVIIDSGRAASPSPSIAPVQRVYSESAKVLGVLLVVVGVAMVVSTSRAAAARSRWAWCSGCCSWSSERRG